MVKKIKDKNAPKRPLTSFILFGNYIRETDSNVQKLPIKDQAIEIGKKWSSASAKDKSKFEDLAAKLKEEYQVKRAEYEKSDQYKEFLSLKSENEPASKKRVKKGPTKMTGYRLFVRELKPDPKDEKDPELAGKGHMSKTAVKWARLSDSEKSKYNSRAAAIPLEGASEESEN